jgi:hypothetical protein
VQRVIDFLNEQTKESVVRHDSQSCAHRAR